MNEYTFTINNIFLPLWLQIGLAILVLLIAVWQAPRIRVLLSVSYSLNQNQTKKDFGAKSWGILLISFVLFIVIGIMADGFFWTLNTHPRTGSDIVKPKGGKHTQKLPIGYAWKKPLWHLGFIPLPVLEKPQRMTNPTENPSISKKEITFEQYDYFIWLMKISGTKQTFHRKETGYYYLSGLGTGRGNQTMMNLSWWDIWAYSNWLSKELIQECQPQNKERWKKFAQKKIISTNQNTPGSIKNALHSNSLSFKDFRNTSFGFRVSCLPKKTL